MKIIGITNQSTFDTRYLVEVSKDELAQLCGDDSYYYYEREGRPPFQIGQTLDIKRLTALIKKTLSVKANLADASQVLRIAAGILEEQLPKLEAAEKASDET